MSASAPCSIDAKIIVVGETGVGKSSLAYCFVHGEFIENQTTLGANLLTRVVHVPKTNYRVHLQIWDTAGQERYRALTRIYYRGISAAVFCYNVTNMDSYLEHKHWLKDIRAHAPEGVLIYTVGTKLDLAGPNDEHREVSFGLVKQQMSTLLAEDEPALPQASPPEAPVRAHRASISMANVLGFRVLNLASSPPEPAPVSKPRPSSMYNPRTAPSSQNPDSPTQDKYASRCREVSSLRRQGVNELFQKIARDLVEQHIAVSQQAADPDPAPDALPSTRPERRTVWLGFRGDELSAQGPGGSRNVQNDSCC